MKYLAHKNYSLISPCKTIESAIILSAPSTKYVIIVNKFSHFYAYYDSNYLTSNDLLTNIIHDIEPTARFHSLGLYLAR